MKEFWRRAGGGEGACALSLSRGLLCVDRSGAVEVAKKPRALNDALPEEDWLRKEAEQAEEEQRRALEMEQELQKSLPQSGRSDGTDAEAGMCV